MSFNTSRLRQRQSDEDTSECDEDDDDGKLNWKEENHSKKFDGKKWPERVGVKYMDLFGKEK